MKKNYVHPTQRVSAALFWVCLLLSQPTWAQSIPDAQWARVGRTMTIRTDGTITTGDGAFLVTYALNGDKLSQVGPIRGVTTLPPGKVPPGSPFGPQLYFDRFTQLSTSQDNQVLAVGYEMASGIGLFNFRGGTSTGGQYRIPTLDGGYIWFFVKGGMTDYPPTVSPTMTIVSKGGAQISWSRDISFPAQATPDKALTKATVLINTPDGGYLVAGYFNISGNDVPELGWVAKLDIGGNISWQKLLNSIPNSSGPGAITGMRSITDVIVTPDGSGYTLVGSAIQANSSATPTAILELDLYGNNKSGRARALDGGPFTNAYLTPYTGSGDKKYYAVGSTSLQDRPDPQIRLVDLASLSVVASRIFPGPGASSLTDIVTAGDGSLVFVTDNNQLVKLQPLPATPTPPTGGNLTLLAPTYNCATGAITFNTSGGNGTPIEYQAAGITGWTTNPNQFVDKDSRTASDVKPFTLMARQSGVVVTYVWDLRAYCSGTPNPPTPPTPPVTPPTGGSLALLAPTYNCATGAFTFNTSGGNGSPIEYQAAGITGWTTNPNQFVDKDSRTASDVKPFTLMARQRGAFATYVWDLRAYCNGTPPTPPTPPVTPPTGGSLALLAPTYNCTTGAITFNTSGGNGSTIEYQAAGITGWTTNPNQFVDKDSRTANDVKPFTLMARQSGVVVTYVWDLKAACGRARTAATEPVAGLHVRVLGNPVENQSAMVEISGATNQSVQLNLVDLRGRLLHQQWIGQAAETERVRVPMGETSGLFLLNVSTATQQQQVKLLKP